MARQQVAEMITGLREELNTTNGRVKNLKSQIARIRNPEAARLVEIREQLAAGETSAEELRKEILRREKQRIDEKELRRTMESFDEVWKAMNLEEQRTLLRQLREELERVDLFLTAKAQPATQHYKHYVSRVDLSRSPRRQAIR